ncbi:GGDEF domain-containing protein [Mesorhizobium sp. LHD-90]|uniref:GGDEF domain-containing protein n=1 Tax=Mesorhizobium sp. LHD-90 TaxID=3071414 RepID=UPI0027E09140|nr:GGDEF domain-containing protein [Mesorhizobium sp. LHD-90]MDQ6434048.1 GGDEF domain-containing protein [Mesorhizobium sp. LHD-90]
MSGAGFILAINFVVAGLLAAAFLTVALYDAKLTAARWFALGYGLGMAYFGVEFTIYMLGSNTPAVVFSFAMVLAGMALFNVGLAEKYSVRNPRTAIAVTFILSVVVCTLIQDMPRTSFWRMLAYQAPYFAMQMIGVWIVGLSRARGRLDTVLLVLLSASSLQFLSKPFLMVFAGGTGATPQDYLTTNYALFSQTLATIFAIGIALLMLVIMVRDILAVVTSKSETDTLSGLYNRGGFERLAASALEDTARQGTPAALVMADLDHFKTVNDTFGHASGDRVIQAFATVLKDAAGTRPIAARLGGEEFAIVLPGANLVAARLFAEGVRSAFSTLPVGGLPSDMRFTASFGVAELLPPENLSGLMRRADEALYVAKKDGRDCVRVARPAAVMPSALVGRAG